ncbi:MAG: hypothetical protein F6K26_15905 [Moorea sp. SIO2I5]|nr:hypothetical protein [Moorena sp. SIO2I5]
MLKYPIHNSHSPILDPEKYDPPQVLLLSQALTGSFTGSLLWHWHDLVEDALAATRSDYLC